MFRIFEKNRHLKKKNLQTILNQDPLCHSFLPHSHINAVWTSNGIYNFAYFQLYFLVIFSGALCVQPFYSAARSMPTPLQWARTHTYTHGRQAVAFLSTQCEIITFLWFLIFCRRLSNAHFSNHSSACLGETCGERSGILKCASFSLFLLLKIVLPATCASCLGVCYLSAAACAYSSSSSLARI